MSAEKMNEELEPALSLVPLVTAADTIRSYCININCEDCPFCNYCCVGCYFEHVTPCEWDINQVISKMTEKVGKRHKKRGVKKP